MIIWRGNGYNVYRTKTHRCACYLIGTEKTHVLIDTSMRFERDAVAESIQKIGVQKIDAIFLTHSHTDHVANAKYFSELYQCKVYISEKGLEKVRIGICDMPKGTNFYGKFIYWAESKIPFYHFSYFQACPWVKPISSNIVKNYLGESSELLKTSGHTDDSISILLSKRVAVVGDAMVNTFGNLYPPFADDEKLVKTSWKALLDTQCELFCPAHGKPLRREELFSSYQKICSL